jgi:hypothetical protein
MKVLLECQNGLGDKILDILGFSVFCDYYNFQPVVNWDSKPFHFYWGKNDYDLRLLKFDKNIQFTINSKKFSDRIESPNPSSSLSPYKVFTYLKKSHPDITFEEVSEKFVKKAKELVKASPFVERCIPKGIENAYGIHLRFSDKVKKEYNPRFEHNLRDFVMIRETILEDLDTIIQNDSEPAFLVVSEDLKWRQEFLYALQGIADKHKKPIKILEPEYINDQDFTGLESVVDMFSLSRTKLIFQGVKYSTFSILASLLGTNKLVNYSNLCEAHDISLIHTWSSVIDINGEKSFDQEQLKRVCEYIEDIQAKSSEK